MGLRFPRPGRAALLAVLILGAAPPAVRAEVTPEELAAADVVVEAEASLTATDRARLEDAATRFRAEGVPTKFVVVATRPAGTTAGDYARELRRAAGFDGNLLVLFLSPGSLGLASTRVPDTELDAAFAAERPRLASDPVGGTISVAERLAQAAATSAVLPPESLPIAGQEPVAAQPGTDSGSDNGGKVAGGLAVVGAVGFGVFALARARRRQAQRFDERRAAMEPLVDALAAQVDGLWQDLSAGGERSAAAQGAWDEAAEAQLAARDRLDRARGEDDLSAARLQLERGLRAAQRARATIEGGPAPGADAPLLAGLCAFDPSHGRAVDAVPVTTAKGATADVPACAKCAAQLAEGATPDVRRTPRGGRAVPYWQGAGWERGGMMPSFGGILGGLFLADLLFDHNDVGVYAGDPGGWDGGDSGDGGDYSDGDYSGGGDFGGGDFGGGDFGGGDFGGGGDF